MDDGPKHGAFSVKTLARDLLSRGFTENQVFRGTNISPSILNVDHPSMPLPDIALFFEHAAKLTGDDTIGLKRGQARDFRKAGLISYVGLSSPTVRDAFSNMIRYMRVFSDAIEFDHSDMARSGKLAWTYAVTQDVNRRQFAEFAAAGMVHDMRVAAHKSFKPHFVAFRHARRTNIDAFTTYFGCDVHFAQHENELHFDPAVLDLPLATSDNDLLSVLRDHCELVLREKGRNTHPLILDVERAIADHLASGRATQSHIASVLGMSSRSLSRKLAEENTTFGTVLDGLRSSLAKAYLRDSDLTVSEIAYLLGYAQSSSFNEAFKRWTDQTPGQYRG